MRSVQFHWEPGQRGASPSQAGSESLERRCVTGFQRVIGTSEAPANKHLLTTLLCSLHDFAFTVADLKFHDQNLFPKYSCNFC